MDLRTRILVRERAGDRCEYCRLRQDQAPLWHHQVEHMPSNPVAVLNMNEPRRLALRRELLEYGELD